MSALRRISDGLADKADANISKWGLQDEATLILAATEELGELAQAFLKSKHEGGQIGRITDEAKDLGALCCQIIYLLEHKSDGRGE